MLQDDSFKGGIEGWVSLPYSKVRLAKQAIDCTVQFRSVLTNYQVHALDRSNIDLLKNHFEVLQRAGDAKRKFVG